MNGYDQSLGVFASIDGQDIAVGELYYDKSANMLSRDPVLAFQYAHNFLENEKCYQISPDLPLTREVIRMSERIPTPGVFRDMLPDEWGSNLIWRSSSSDQYVMSVVENPQFLHQLDVLKITSDLTRQGNLRLANESNEFIAPQLSPLPIVDSLDEIAESKNHYLSNIFETEEILRLKNVVSSIGGAAPKVSCLDRRGNLYIAKFFKADITGQITSNPIFEEVCLRIARELEIETEKSQLIQLSNGEYAFIAKRFDRLDGNRIPYLSLYSMVEGKVNRSETSYELLGELVFSKFGAKASKDFFVRVALNIAVNNTDDHLGNTGFLFDFSSEQWELAPLFDIYPNSNIKGQSPVSVKKNNVHNSRGFSDLIDIAPVFGLSKDVAKKITHKVASAVSSKWVEQALALGAQSVDIDRYELVFSLSSYYLRGTVSS
ncbi:MAG: type II toxin-antitoxin system HipA family toxin [Bifidobacteriaceae bacterium]|jgi:serine/threonine-protein kinase HipA|nr:type II toxin-antitoxin system HipA family toxin [Bifidobacteriaceae bacterium]